MHRHTYGHLCYLHTVTRLMFKYRLKSHRYQSSVLTQLQLREIGFVHVHGELKKILAVRKFLEGQSGLK